MAKTYTFEEQLALGQRGEHDLDCVLLNVYPDLRPATLREEKQGIDRVGTYPPSGRIHTIQIKSDWVAHRTGNAFIETVSRDKHQKPGWVYTCQADLIIYYLPEIPRIYCIKPSTLKAALPEWEKQYSTAIAKNRTYNTLGILVPLIEIERITIARSIK